MLRRRAGFFAAIMTAGALLLTGCAAGAGASTVASIAGANLSKTLSFLNGTAAQHHAPPGTGDFALKPGKPSTPIAQRWVQLTAAGVGALNPVVVNGQGFTLYRFDKDTSSPSVSHCDGACALTWPPVLIAPHGKVFVQGVNPADVGVITRTDGTHQITIGGHPVYRFAKDLNPGDTNGQGVGGTWFGIQPDGGKSGQADTTVSVGQAPSASPAAGPASATLDFGPGFSDASGSQGIGGAPDTCQSVTRTKDGSLDSVSGTLTLYTGSGCTGGSWVVKGDVTDLAAIGFNGRLASVFVGDNDRTKPATSAILDDDAAFSDNDGSQAVSGAPGTCQELSRPAVTSSVFNADGRMTLWSGKGCTGDSVVIDGNVTHLAAIGFDNKTMSVSFS